MKKTIHNSLIDCGTSPCSVASAPLSSKPSSGVWALAIATVGFLCCANHAQAQKPSSEFITVSMPIPPVPTDDGVTTPRGPNVHISDHVSKWHAESSDPRLTGLRACLETRLDH